MFILVGVCCRDCVVVGGLGWMGLLVMIDWIFDRFGYMVLLGGLFVDYVCVEGEN